MNLVNSHVSVITDDVYIDKKAGFKGHARCFIPKAIIPANLGKVQWLIPSYSNRL